MNPTEIFRSYIKNLNNIDETFEIGKRIQGLRVIQMMIVLKNHFGWSVDQTQREFRVRGLIS
jgi:hypothetical protein